MPITITGQSGPIAGTLCRPRNATKIQVLVHGLSYGRYYWDLPYEPERYSYPKEANERGYATLAIDRLGIGKSWHPVSPLVNYDNNTSAVHQVIQAVRRGDLGGRFDKVVLIGHSLGSVIAYQEAGTYQDVDAVVFTGAAHGADVMNVVRKIRLNAIPAILDPKFTGQGYDPGYQTTRAGTRGDFYYPPNSDPKVIALDEKLKQTFNDVELGTGSSYLGTSATKNAAASPSKRINVPTFTINGDQDAFFCKGPVAADCSSSAALANYERPYFGPHAVVEAKVIPGAGHNLNLERSAPDSNKAILDFIDRHTR
ncbi:alpha/beta hydrolase [Pseudonocardia eucalypti]|uniref:Alpha/beta hydrolase n=1 Tax=Pseudonocardia eucalypti TaxID=648755 RepID=A0ABP9RDB0_9PSEU